jgi:GAF domain-containing protein/ActR/RegA family two-component response regulator
MRWTIRAKLVALVMAALLPLVAGAAYRFWEDRLTARERVVEDLLGAVHTVGRHLDEVLAGQIQNLEALASVRGPGDLASADLAALARRVRASHPFVRRFYAAAPDGRVLAVSDAPAPPTAALPQRGAFQAALASRQVEVSGLEPSPVDGQPVICLLVPAVGPGGAVTGVIAAELDGPGLARFLEDPQQAGELTLVLAAADGRVLTAWGQAAGHLGSRVAPAGGARAPEAVTEWTGGDGVRYLTAARRLVRVPWRVVALVPSAVAFTPAAARFEGNLVALGLATALGLLLAGFLARRMHASVRSLTEAVRALAQGQAVRIQVRSGDELGELAEQFTRAVEGRRLAEGRLEARERRLQALARVNVSLSQQLDPESLLGQITDALAGLLEAPVVVLWEALHEERRLLRRAWTADPAIQGMGLPLAVGFDEGAVGWVASHRRPLVVDDVARDPRVLAADWALRHDLTVLVALPVEAAGRLVGVLSVNLARGRVLGEDEQALCLSFATQAAVALRNARLYAEAERRRRAAEALADLGRALVQSLDPEVVGQRIADSVRALLGTSVAGLYRLDPQTGDLHSVAVSGIPGGAGDPPAVFPRGTGVVALVVAGGRPVATPDLLEDPRVSLADDTRARIARVGYRSVLSVPLALKGAVVGALSVGDRAGRIFDDEEIRLAQTFADHAGVALRNARLYAEAERRRREAEELARVGRALAQARDPDAVAGRIVEGLRDLLNARAATLFRLEPATGDLVAWSGAGTLEERLGEEGRLGSGVGLVGLAVAAGAPAVSADLFADPRVTLTPRFREILDQAGIRAGLAVPLSILGRPIGVLGVGDGPGRVFGQAEVDLAQAFADQAAVALESARLYAETRERLRHVDSLRAVVEQILVPFSLEERLDLIARKAAELFGAEHAGVALRVEGRDELVMRAGYRLKPAEMGRVVPFGMGALGLAAARREGVLVNDYARWPHRDPVVMALHPDDPPQAMLACPLLIRGELIGALTLGAHAAGRRFAPEDLDRLTSFAAPAALAIEHSRLYAELETRLRELQETQAQLVQAAKLSALGQLVSGVAHELNNPLSVVLGHGQLLLGRALPPDMRRPVELIVSQGERMARIVQSLLLFSRQRKADRGPVDLAAVVDQTLSLRTAQLRLSGVHLEVGHAADLPRVDGDAHQLQQVFLNLLLNAEQAILGGGQGDRIRVSTGVRDDSGGPWVALEVEDNGPGVPPEVLPRIFEPFFTTKAVGQGTGLGLSVSYGIVQQHGGRLLAESRPGRTVFTVLLPVHRGAPDSGRQPALPQAVGQGRRALLVEDEPGVAELVTALLGQTGWQVDACAGGRPALDQVRGRRYDLVVSDVRMADGSGEDFYRAAVAEQPQLARRFLFITGDTANPAVWRFLQEARAPVLEKPFAPDALLRAVERVAGGDGDSPGGEPPVPRTPGADLTAPRPLD